MPTRKTRQSDTVLNVSAEIHDRVDALARSTWAPDSEPISKQAIFSAAIDAALDDAEAKAWGAAVFSNEPPVAEPDDVFIVNGRAYSRHHESMRRFPFDAMRRFPFDAITPAASSVRRDALLADMQRRLRLLTDEDLAMFDELILLQIHHNQNNAPPHHCAECFGMWAAKAWRNAINRAAKVAAIEGA